MNERERGRLWSERNKTPSRISSAIPMDGSSRGPFSLHPGQEAKKGIASFRFLFTALQSFRKLWARISIMAPEILREVRYIGASGPLLRGSRTDRPGKRRSDPRKTNKNEPRSGIQGRALPRGSGTGVGVPPQKDRQ